ncbi:unnamed protein product [Ectocarpus sp. 4 AP-2014]
METSSAATAVQPQWKSVDGDSDPKPRSLKPTSYGVRRSCDACGRRKKKCDGERPCRRCLRTSDECTYSKRRWHLPDHQQQQEEQQQPNPDQVHPTQVLLSSTSCAVLRRGGMLSFKRCRLSASPATGLVGMQENSFLSDFFGCVGFLPLTTQSHIRETMVKIMLTPASRQQSAFGDGCVEAGQSDAIASGGRFGNTFDRKELPMDPSTCIFWCAVALGALVKGSPIESVAGYTQLATEALAKSYSGPADAEVAKAWAILGYLHGFMGDEAKFQEYLAPSDTLLATSIEQGSTDTLPLGFAEIIQHRDIGDTSPGRIESICSREQVLPQLNAGASEHELYRYVMQSFRVFMKDIYSQMLKRTAADREPLGAVEPAGEGTGDQPHYNVVPRPQEISDAMASVWSQDNIVQFGPLEEASDRPSIRAGVGGMLINGTLVFEMACEGDVRSTLKRIGRSVEVFARYPGLCRFQRMGAHEAHMMLAALAALDDSGAPEMYDRLRAAYNPCRPLGSSPVPPLEEWQGMSSICEDVYCRAIERVMASDKMRAFSNPGDGIVPNEVGGDKSFGLAGQNQSRLLGASISPEEEPFVPAPCFPGSSRGGSVLSSACESSRGLSRVSHGGTAQCLESTGEPTTLTAPASSPLYPNRCHSEILLDDEHGASRDTNVVRSRHSSSAEGLAARPEMPAGLGEEAIEEMGHNDIAAADWLDVSIALLDAVNESGQAFSG